MRKLQKIFVDDVGGAVVGMVVGVTAAINQAHLLAAGMLLFALFFAILSARAEVKSRRL